MEIAITVEGHYGLSWSRWKKMVRAVEDLGFAALYRSDHFVKEAPPDEDSLEMWTSLTWLASHTTTLPFGTLVTPFSFRDPVFTARTAKDVDALSGGRLTLGVGAGWEEREHVMFNYPLDKHSGARFRRLEEGAEVVYRLLRDPARVTMQGEFYGLRDAVLLPRPIRPDSPRLMIGGNGEKRTLPLVARLADEWNAVYITPEKFVLRNSRLNELLDEAGRPRNLVRRSLMQGLIFGKDQEALAASHVHGLYSPYELEVCGVLVETAATIGEPLAHYAEAGVEQLILQWMDCDDLAGLETLAKAVL
jgi:alkanesulfonate monooxygenase SsuD/methylene tetrahydromethanopterin reductase-like flavin-dependent oxidoreductase (luciferase family)